MKFLEHFKSNQYVHVKEAILKVAEFDTGYLHNLDNLSLNAQQNSILGSKTTPSRTKIFIHLLKHAQKTINKALHTRTVKKHLHRYIVELRRRNNIITDRLLTIKKVFSKTSLLEGRPLSVEEIQAFKALMPIQDEFKINLERLTELEGTGHLEELANNKSKLLASSIAALMIGIDAAIKIK
ncbi:hypothetical protein GOV04_00695 [Candidatus Woesearchaeota archaeon]|nr:hypothetical protein [Candidatus Woesearchaeota archaeon]